MPNQTNQSGHANTEKAGTGQPSTLAHTSTGRDFLHWVMTVELDTVRIQKAAPAVLTAGVCGRQSEEKSKGETLDTGVAATFARATARIACQPDGRASRKGGTEMRGIVMTAFKNAGCGKTCRQVVTDGPFREGRASNAEWLLLSGESRRDALPARGEQVSFVYLLLVSCACFACFSIFCVCHLM